MKKIVLFALVVMLIPFTAIGAMNVISDTAMDNVTGQRGVTLAPVDANLDLRIENIAYIDADEGVLVMDPDGVTVISDTRQMIAGIPNPYTQGVINITGVQIDNLHATLAGVLVPGAGSGTGLGGGIAGSGNVDMGPGLGFASVYAEGIDIDVETYANVPLVTLRDSTVIVIGMPDLSLTIDKITIAEISLDADPAAVGGGGYNDGTGHVEGILNPATGQFDFETAGITDPTHSIGSIEIAGLKLRTYAHVGGVDPATGAPINAGHRGVIIIKAH